jgi:hypothetical protein
MSPLSQALHTFYRDRLYQEFGMSAQDEKEACEMLNHFRYKATMYNAQDALQQAQYQAMGISNHQGLSGTSVAPPPPVQPKPQPVERQHYTRINRFNDVGDKLLNALYAKLPLKLTLPITAAVFVTTETLEGRHTNPRVVVRFWDGSSIEFPIDDETNWPGDDVIGRIALEAP